MIPKCRNMVKGNGPMNTSFCPMNKSVCPMNKSVCPMNKCSCPMNKCSSCQNGKYNALKANNVNVDKFNFAMHRQCPLVSVKVTETKGFWDATGNYNT